MRIKLGFLGKILLAVLPSFVEKYVKKNPKSAEYIGVVMTIISAQYGKGASKAEILARIEAELKNRGASDEIVILALAYAEQRLLGLGVQ